MKEQSGSARWFGCESRLPLPARIALAAGLLVLVVLNALLVANQFSIILAGYPGADFVDYQLAAKRVWAGGLYAGDGEFPFRYSPVAAYLFAPLGLMAPAVWRGLHVVAALALPTWPMRLLLLASWPFAFDLQLGNVMTFVLLAAAWALRGNRIGALVFLAFLLLFPRPLMLPIAAWLLWRQPWLRLPFLAMFVVHAALVLASGLGDAWIGRLLSSTDQIGSAFNIGPSTVIGLWWLLLGIPLGAWLFWRGRAGLAGLAISPYLLPYYLMVALLDLPSSRRSAEEAPVS
jgi:uncharacterized membrane protein